MTALTIRKKLVSYLQVAEEKKIKAVYALLQDDIEQEEWEYSVALKKQLDEGASYYKKGGKMINVTEVTKEINKTLQSKKS